MHCAHHRSIFHACPISAPFGVFVVAMWQMISMSSGRGGSTCTEHKALSLEDIASILQMILSDEKKNAACFGVPKQGRVLWPFERSYPQHAEGKDQFQRKQLKLTDAFSANKCFRWVHCSCSKLFYISSRPNFQNCSHLPQNHYLLHKTMWVFCDKSHL